MISETRSPVPDGYGAEPHVAASVPAQDQPAATPAVRPDLIEPGHLRSVVEAAGSVVAQTTLVTALLYYFGFNYTEALARSFGIDANTLGYSTHDYVLRSVVPAAPAFGGLLLMGLVLMGIHGKLKGWLDSRRHLRALELLAGTMVVVGTALLVTGVFAIVGGVDWWFGSRGGDVVDRHLILLPLSVLVGVAGAAYGTQIRRVWLSSAASQGVAQSEPRWLRLVKLALLFVLIAMNVFWAAGEFATSLGQQRAETLVRKLPGAPDVIVHSKVALGIDPGGGVSVDQVGGAEDGYRFRYRGLRYLTRSAGKFFLLSPCWSNGTGRTIVLTDDDSVQVEVGQSTTPPPCG